MYAGNTGGLPVLSNPESRHEYDKELGGGQIRVFRTFTVGPEDDEQAAPFVVYWNAACRLQETVDLAMEFLENNSQKKNVRSVLPPERCCF